MSPKKTALVIMAAGIGSRFDGGIKQFLQISIQFNIPHYILDGYRFLKFSLDN